MQSGIYQRKLSPNSVPDQFTPTFNQRLFDVKGETIGIAIHGNVNNHIPFLQRCPLAIDLRGFEMFLQTEFLLPYTHKNKNDLHIWASLRGLAGSRAAKIRTIIDNANYLA